MRLAQASPVNCFRRVAFTFSRVEGYVFALCLVGGLFLLIIVFSWNLDMEYIIDLMEQTPHMGTGEKRKMTVGRALNQG